MTKSDVEQNKKKEDEKIRSICGVTETLESNIYYSDTWNGKNLPTVICVTLRVDVSKYNPAALRMLEKKILICDVKIEFIEVGYSNKNPI